MSRTIGILSGKGGVGKTTVTANLGAALTHVFKKNVIIFDMNVHASHLGLHLGMYEDPPVTLREVLTNRTPVLHAVYIHPSTGIRIIPVPLNGEVGKITQAKLKKLVNQIKNNYDMIFLDCAPGLGKEVVTAIRAIDEALVVTTPDIPAVTDAMKTINLLEKMDKNVLGIVLNRYENQSYTLKENEIESACNRNVISKIPEDKKIPESISKGVPAVLLYPNCAASISLKKLAGYLSGGIYQEEGLWDRIKSFFSFAKILPPVEEEKIPEKEQVRQEIVDVEKMRRKLMKEVREELKKEIVEKVRRRMRERYAR